MPQKSFDFKSVIPTGDLALFSRHTGTLVGKFARSEIPKLVAVSKNDLHPQKSQEKASAEIRGEFSELISWWI